jgi:hypothetical protein
LGLEPRDIISVHTPTTGPAYERRQSYDALFILGETLGEPLSKALQVIETDLASQGFFAIIGRDFLKECRFVYDGPSDTFTIHYRDLWRPISMATTSVE